MNGKVVLMMALPLLTAVPAAAQQDTAGAPRVSLSGNVAVASDYTFRGVSQTLEEPAIQGGLDLQAPFGLYLGTWGSNVNFGEDLDAGARAQVELDVYGGIARSLGGVVDVDLGFIYYAYPGAARGRNYNFLEWGLGASRSLLGADLGASMKYSPDFFGGSGEAFYYGAQLEVPVSLLTLSGSLGRQTIRDNETFGLPDYVDWSAGVAVGVVGVDLGARLVGTNLSQAECFAGGSELCQTRVVLSISRGM